MKIWIILGTLKKMFQSFGATGMHHKLHDGVLSINNCRRLFPYPACHLPTGESDLGRGGCPPCSLPLPSSSKNGTHFQLYLYLSFKDGLVGSGWRVFLRICIIWPNLVQCLLDFAHFWAHLVKFLLYFQQFCPFFTSFGQNLLIL